jgi:membrane protease subunit (stomatin/prohibitin family)
MGFFGAFKNLFNKNIECGEEIDNHILYFLKNKKKLYFGKNLIVRDNTNCVIVYKKRVCDVLLPGKYKLTKESIPICYDKAKVEKKESKGKKVKQIKVSIYYINTSEFKDFDFMSDSPFVIKNKDLGKIKGCLKGKCVVRTIDSALLIKTLLSKCKKIKNAQVENLIGNIIGNKINKKFEKAKIPFDMLISNQTQVNTILNTELEDAFDKQGIFVKNVSLKYIDVANKHKQKVNDYIAKHKRVVKQVNVTNQNFNNRIDVPVTSRNKEIGINKVCKRCGYKNMLTDIKCRNCNNVLD